MPFLIIGLLVLAANVVGGALEGEAEEKRCQAEARLQAQRRRAARAEESMNRTRQQFDGARASARRTAGACRQSMRSGA